MPESTVYRPHQEAPAHATFSAMTTGRTEGRVARSFEFVSRGDFVGGRLMLPESIDRGPAPLVLLTLAAGQAALLERVGFAREWVRQGFALAMIDLPLHGRRSSPKLSQRLLDGIDRLTRGESLDLDTRALVEEFARQSTSDLTRACEALVALPEIDPKRIGLAGIGLGAITSAYAYAHDPRICSAVLAVGPMRISDPGLDPAAQFSARPAENSSATLIVELGPAEAKEPSNASPLAQRLYEAVPGHKDRATLSMTAPRGHGSRETTDEKRVDEGLPAEVEQAARRFLVKQLAL